MLDAAEDHHVTNADMSTVRAEALEDLAGQFTGWCKDERSGATGIDASAFALAVGPNFGAFGPLGAGCSKLVQHWQRKRRGFAGAGLSAAEYIVAGEYLRDGLDLNWGGGFVAFCGDRPNNRLGEPQF